MPKRTLRSFKVSGASTFGLEAKPFPDTLGFDDAQLPGVRNLRKSSSSSPVMFALLASLAIVTVYRTAPYMREFHHRGLPNDHFYSNIVTNPTELCSGPDNHLTSHSGHIGLKGDSPDQPKRSFFWYFEAENDPQNAPVILTIGGGPGTSGMMNAVFGQSPCLMTENGTVFNKNRWSEHFNLIALDHPIGVGYSYGTRVNNSYAAAHDVYDFLQKFFNIYPHLVKNQLFLSGGSYGGIYVPNIATVIHTQNLAIAEGKEQQGSKYINLEALILSNPISNPMAHFSWLLQYRCVDKNVHNSTTCQELYSILPSCLEKIQLAFEISTPGNRVAAQYLCDRKLAAGDTHDTVLEDVRLKCHPDPDDPASCHPEFPWANTFFQDPDTKRVLGVPEEVNFTSLSMQVNEEFYQYGDMMQPHHLLFESLFRAGIRVLHYVGAQDANCAWPGILSNLKLIKSQHQQEFLETDDRPWPKQNRSGTVRVVGAGAGSMTYILLDEAGHFTVKDQPALAKSIVEHWVRNQDFFDES